MRLRNVCVLSNFVAALAPTWAGAAMSQDYPTRPVRIVPSPAGGGSDQARGLSRRACRRCSASR
jgi:tripartite-type tricarboxylate transporter receptor subunit TctC